MKVKNDPLAIASIKAVKEDEEMANLRIPKQYEESLDSGVEYIAIPKVEIDDLVNKYVLALETEVTNKWCKCEWIIHPEDVNLDVHNCAGCGHPRLLHNKPTIQIGNNLPACTKIINNHHDESPIPQKSFAEDCLCKGWVDPPRRRMRRGDTHPECPVHTKEGFLLGFFEWVFKDDK